MVVPRPRLLTRLVPWWAVCLLAVWLLAAPWGAGAAAEPDREADRAYAEALTALKDGRWVQAELMLERTLMFNPDHAEARVELAALLALGGRAESASALIQSLIADPRTSEAHRSRLRALMMRTAAGPTGDLAPDSNRSVLLAEGFVAWTRNPLARADLSQLTLTFPEGSVSLPVDQRVRSGVISGLAVQRISPQGLSIDAGVQRLEDSDTGSAYRLAFSGPVPVDVPAVPTSRWLLQTQRALDGNVRHTAAVSSSGAVWRLSGGVFLEPELSRDGLFFRVERTRPLGQGLRASVFGGLEHPFGGVSGYWRMGAALAWQPRPAWSVLGQAMMHRDFSGYSPWLESGARRRMHSLDLAVERYWQPMGPDWQVVARAHLSRRWSNLALFEYQDTGLQLSLRRRWQ